MPTGQLFSTPDSHELSWMKSFLEDFVDLLDVRSHDLKVREDRATLTAAITKICVLQSGKLTKQAAWGLMMQLVPWRKAA